MTKRFSSLQKLSQTYSAWIEIQQDADEVYHDIILGSHSTPKDIIEQEFALFSLLEQEAQMRKVLIANEPDHIRAGPRPAQSRDQQYGKRIAVGLRLLGNRIKLESEKLKIKIKSVDGEIQVQKKLTRHGCPHHIYESFHILNEVSKGLDSLLEKCKLSAKVASMLENRDTMERLERFKSTRKSLFDLYKSRKVHATIQIEEEEAAQRANKRLIQGTEEEVVDVLVDPIYEPR
jgi:hypothetical protein